MLNIHSLILSVGLLAVASFSVTACTAYVNKAKPKASPFLSAKGVVIKKPVVASKVKFKTPKKPVKKRNKISHQDLVKLFRVDVAYEGLETGVYRAKQAKYISNTANNLKQAILEHEKSQPTAHAPSSSQLSKCRFISHRVEVDNKAGTAEWLITTLGQGRCQTQSRYQAKTFWVVQQQGNKQAKVLLANRAHSALFQDLKKGEALKSISAFQENKIGSLKVKCYRYLNYNGRLYEQTGERREAYMRHAMMSHKMWLETTDSAYQCLD